MATKKKKFWIADAIKDKGSLRKESK